MKPSDYIAAARVPMRLKPQSFGPWSIRRVFVSDLWREMERKLPPKFAVSESMVAKLKIGFDSYTLLHRYSWATLHLETPEVVMEDSWFELQKHLPIWMRAEGRVLVTGLGLGCVVRGLLAKPQVQHITVIEIDKSILRVIGHEFAGNPRVELIHGDALTFHPNGHSWDYAWHDLWTDGDRDLQCLHAELFKKFMPCTDVQGAWMFPRYLKRRLPKWILR
jgi:hypothetical protein